MKAIITSCNRHDLLITTLESLWGFDEYIIFEDSHKIVPKIKSNQRVIYSGHQQGQNHAINRLYLHLVKHERYVFHCEDDWLFDYDNTGWIEESITMIEKFNLIKVQARTLADNPHKNIDENHIIQPWNGWNGFTWNPGVTDVLKMMDFLPLPDNLSEFELDKRVKYKTGQLVPGICKHIGEGRSTHAN